jgi:hypothetical protein
MEADISCVAELCGGELPKLFALVQEFDEEDAVVREIVAYGIAMPDGSAATCKGPTFARWQSAESASRRLCSELVWLSSAG